MKHNEFQFLQNSGLPWILPKKTFSLDLGVSDALDDLLGVWFFSRKHCYFVVNLPNTDMVLPFESKKFMRFLLLKISNMLIFGVPKFIKGKSMVNMHTTGVRLI